MIRLGDSRNEIVRERRALSEAGVSGTPDVLSKTRVSIDTILSMDGTSLTILLSENEQAGHWIWDLSDGIPAAWSSVEVDVIEGLVGFAFPHELSSIGTGEVPIYRPLHSLF